MEALTTLKEISGLSAMCFSDLVNGKSNTLNSFLAITPTTKVIQEVVFNKDKEVYIMGKLRLMVGLESRFFVHEEV